MGILDEDIQRIRDATDIVAVVSEHVQLKRVGRRFQGLCPFHSEKTPSFSVNQEAGLYYCFGCRASGDVITFVREVEKLDFVGAVEKLASRAGITLRYTDTGEHESRKHKAALYEAVERAVEWYHQRLLTAPDAAKARAYLRSRGFDGNDVRRYRIGWAPEGWDELARALRLPENVFVGSGLGFLNRQRRPTDAFRGRVVFPVFDTEGRAVGFGARILPGGQGPKYKNSAQSAIYDKSRLLYGLNWAKGEIVNADEAIVCEGYTDVIGFAKAGLPRAVATCGTALTGEHLRLLKSFARRVVLAFDADAAGQNAAERFYEWERQYEIDVAVAALPTGVDPSDLARDDPQALLRAVAEAEPFLGFRVNRVLATMPLSTPEQRARAAEAALDVVREHPSDLVRDQYLLDVAARTRIDPERLRERAARTRRAAGAKSGDRRADRAQLRQPGAPGGRDSIREGPEIEALRLLVCRPDEVRDWLFEELFGDDLSLAAYRALVETDGVRAAIERADPAAGELLRRIAVEESTAEPLDVVDLLLAEAGRRAITELEAEVRLADDPLAYSQTIAWLKLTIEDLQSEHPSVGSREQLLAWLTQQSEDEG
ncbi:MAG: DNA primase [Acidimicrobiales bacterium]|nr:DNA primase [Acidimicrobiales bacterium]